MKASRIALLLVAALAPACADRPGDTTSRRDSVPPGPSAAPGGGTVDVTRAQYAAALNVDLATMQRTSGGAWFKDLTVGTGATVDSGSTVSIHYVGHLPNGTQFDANQPPSQPYTFVAGVGQVIDGFDEAVDGMKAGGRRQVVIPPELGYGAQGVGPIPPNSILVFTIEVVSAR